MLTGQIGWKVSAALIAPFLCTAMPPAGVKDPLFLHSALSGASRLRKTRLPNPLLIANLCLNHRIDLQSKKQRAEEIKP